MAARKLVTLSTGTFELAVEFSDGSTLVETYRYRRNADAAAYRAANTYRSCLTATVRHKGKQVVRYVSKLFMERESA